MRQSTWLAAGLVLMTSAAVAGCAPAANGNNAAVAVDESAAAVETVKAREQALLQSYASRNIEEARTFYADDATLIFPWQPQAQGRAAVDQNLRAMVSDPAFALTFDNQQTRVAASGDLAYTRGIFSNTYTDPVSKRPVTMKGTYLTVFRKEVDGSWKAIEDMATPGPVGTAGPA